MIFHQTGNSIRQGEQQACYDKGRRIGHIAGQADVVHARAARRTQQRLDILFRPLIQKQKCVAVHAETFQAACKAGNAAVKADDRERGALQRIAVGNGLRQMSGCASDMLVAAAADKDRALPGKDAGKTERRLMQLRRPFRKLRFADVAAGCPMAFQDGKGGIRHGFFPNISLYAKAYLLTSRGNGLAVAAGIS